MLANALHFIVLESESLFAHFLHEKGRGKMLLMILIIPSAPFIQALVNGKVQTIMIMTVNVVVVCGNQQRTVTTATNLISSLTTTSAKNTV